MKKDKFSIASNRVDKCHMKAMNACCSRQQTVGQQLPAVGVEEKEGAAGVMMRKVMMRAEGVMIMVSLPYRSNTLPMSSQARTSALI